jgi:hypothetical protein
MFKSEPFFEQKLENKCFLRVFLSLLYIIVYSCVCVKFCYLLFEVSFLKKIVRGWLANPERKDRKDRANTFTNQDALKLINKINAIPAYVSSKLDSRFERLLRLRDKALIATSWICSSVLEKS